MNSRKYMFLLFFLIPAISLPAQPNEKPLRLMIQAEPHLNWFHAGQDHLTGDTVRPGIGLGMRLDYHYEKWGALSFGVNWNLTGGSLFFSGPVILDRSSGQDTLASGSKLIYGLRYVQIPVAMKFNLPEIGYTTLFCEVGLDPMIRTHAAITVRKEEILREEFLQGVAGFNLAYHAGAGFIYSFGNGLALQVLAVYTNTFLDVTTENDIRTPDNVRINQLGLSLGLIF